MIKQHIEKAIGAKESVLMKTNSEYGFEIYHYANDSLSYQILFTVGLSKNVQDVDSSNEGLEKIELYFALPPFWNIKNHEWPINWLDRIACIPQKNKTWFGNGDTIPAGNPPEYLHEAFLGNHFMICKPDHLEDVFSGEEWMKSGFEMMAVMVLFQLEVDFKLRNSHTVLIKKLKKKGVTEVFDPYRVSSCRKRILGMV